MLIIQLSRCWGPLGKRCPSSQCASKRGKFASRCKCSAGWTALADCIFDAPGLDRTRSVTDAYLFISSSISLLSLIKPQLDANVQEAIYRNILAYDKVFPLRCYGNNSFIHYLNGHFQNFSEFLTLKDTILQIPSNQLLEVLNSINPSELADLLSRPGFIDDNKILIRLLTYYRSVQNLVTFIDDFNQKSQDSQLTDDNRAAILEVLWFHFTTVLSDLNDTDVEEWLNVRLQPYLLFITTDLLASNNTLTIQCLPYRKM
uniref:uncharacterized protein n=1 Tax=Pristiophorus japonicus TaxID=55135 RepID=UPI00398EE654